MEGDSQPWLRFVARAVSLGFSIGVPFAVLVSCGALVGAWLDKRQGTGPWLTLGGVVLGSILAFVSMLRVLALFERREGGEKGRGDDGDER